MSEEGVSSVVCHKILLRTLPIHLPSLDKTKGGKEVSAPGIKGAKLYWERHNEDFTIETFNFFPAILSADGSPWAHANLYLLSKLKSMKLPKATTLEGIANDLVVFRRFLDADNLDYLCFPKRKLLRPTYRYRADLADKVRDGEVSPNTASRRMSSVIGFYRWIESRGDCRLEHPAWQEKDVSVSFLDEKGFLTIKPVKSTDLAVQVPQNRDDYSGKIQDGGKLRPLERAEQRLLIEALKSIGNTEMTLAFLVALTTGARIQTVFTLRLKHFTNPKPEAGEHALLIGMGTGIDTKFQKRIALYVPNWLHNRLVVYGRSQRAEQRRRLSKHGFSDPGDQYLFLTKPGKPYYIAESDPCLSSYRKPPNGAPVREFISTYLANEFARMGAEFTFRFHDLRATYGMNLLEEKLRLVEEGKSKLFDVLMLVKTRMGHNSLRTTEGYLEFRKKFELAMTVQSEFEEHLMALSASTKGEGYEE